ncbi:F-box domain [Macleaya cordata]|uniref:F-box domain n=1 Tax=Macleaya cordata TaxID=56857 RepID=A0A200Q873_MACCD|nr:F-box domain [Macleaya cordata]
MEARDLANPRKMKMKNEGDRISNLPDTVLHHILSFLDMKYVVQTSVLSRRWRYVWASLPFLTFKEAHRFGEHDFEHFVDRVLILRDSSSNIQSFRVSCLRFIDRKDRLYTWVLTALRRNVQKLSLGLCFEKNFRFPNCLYTCKSLKKLELLCDDFYFLKLSLPDSMSLPSLKTLILQRVQFKGDDIPNKIFSSCPVLESLSIRKCEFRQSNLYINAPKLKHLVIEKCDDVYEETDLDKRSIKLYAPNLLSFYCDDHILKKYCIENLSALVKAEISMNVEIYGLDGLRSFGDEIRKVCVQRMMKFLRALQNVETLRLSVWFLEVISGAPALLEGVPTQFSNLRCLKLETWLSRDCVNLITYILEISPNVESLFLEINEDFFGMQPMYPYWDEVWFNSPKIEVFWEAGVSLQCMLHHLKYVEIRGVQGRLNELMFLKILLKNALVLEKVVLYPSKEKSSHTKKWLIKVVDQLLTLPRASSSIAILLL